MARIVVAVLRAPGPGGPAPAVWPTPNDVRFTTPNGTFDVSPDPATAITEGDADN